jgi:succinyl-CoA synthetase alpha subunit
MREYGTNVVADVRGKGGQTVLGVRVFNTAQEAVKALGGHRYFGAFCARGGVKEAAISAIAPTFISQAPSFAHQNCFQK